jgi:hypothetical protein
MNQEQINSNFQERLNDLQVQHEIITAFLIASIETHPSPQQLKDKFSVASEQLIALAAYKPLPEKWIEQLNGYQGLLYRALDRRIAVINQHRS